MPNLQEYRIEVRPQQLNGASSSTGRINTIRQLGFDIESCVEARLFFLQGELTLSEVQQIASRLLADPVTDTYEVYTTSDSQTPLADHHTIEITLLPGVTDPVAENLVWAAQQLGCTSLARAATGTRYELRGKLTDVDLDQIANRVFANPVIQHVDIDRPAQPPFVPFREADSTVEIITLCDVSDEQLLAISADRRLSLDLNEMRAIRTYFEVEGRNPTDVELEMLAQTWSEHCVHKTFRASIDFDGPEGQQQINGLLKTYIRAATEQINKSWVRSAFVDNAGIVAFNDQFDLAFKVETHNHPSALEPFGGANTGVGGVIRDVLGVSARPIANTDVLCFGPQDLPDASLPAGVLHPRRIQEGVVHGIEDYGNKMGIPTVNGAIFYQQGYTSNPLVFCGCLGLLPRDSHPVGAQAGDLVVVLGGRTGRDGLRGATFSSMEMDEATSGIAGSAVQIGHPINEKQCLEVVLKARDEKLYSAITDCGAGGLSSAVGEMASELGATVQLERVLLKYPGLRPWEIWLSEAQERMVLAVPPANWDRFSEICAGHDIEAVAIGEFTGDGRLHLCYGDQTVGEMSVHFLHEGIPTRYLKAEWKPIPITPPTYPANPDFTADLLALLAHPNIRSKEAVIRKYDHEVQGGVAIKPLVGVADHGPGDAAVIVPPRTASHAPRGVVLSAGLCPQYGEIDPYAMAWAAIDEAVRNAVAVGADPDQISILDNFCWGNPNLPDRLGSLVRAAQGCYDAALAYGTPFISGKDSLNNEYLAPDGQKHAIPGTLLISALGIVPDVTKAVTMDLKKAGNLLYLIGETRDEMGGSHYHMLHGIEGGTVPQPNPDALNTMRALHKAIQAGVVVSCHDCSEGGLAVALAEMCIAGRLGAHLGGVGLSVDQARTNMFSESSGRFVIEVALDKAHELKQFFGQNIIGLGAVTENAVLVLDQIHSFGAIDVGDPGKWDRYAEVSIADLELAFRVGLPIAPVAEISESPVHSNTNDYNTPVFITKRRPRVLILHARGTNRDGDAALACELAGGDPEIVTVHQLTHRERNLLDYSMLVIPGGFSFGDDLGAGVLWSMVLKEMLGDDLRRFVESGRPVLGICNGFQTLVKSGLLFDASDASQRSVTLTYNASAHFECRWVYLKPNPVSPSLFTRGLDTLIHCPVAHGEGRIAVSDAAALERLQSGNLIALSYVDAAGNEAEYPANPNGSALSIAALTNAAGNVLGLMPHPEDHIYPWQHPRWTRGEAGLTGLRLFENGIRNA